ncbi:MAG: DNA-binding response regulator [bacterium]|nr:MAG: DNA-binding response regulator [bacterium]
MSLIYIIDDEEELLEILSINLKSEGYEVKEFLSGNELINQLLNGTAIPDLLLLDIMMEGMTGYEVCRKLRLDGRFQNIPIIFLTAKSGEEERIAGFEYGADDYISKPFSTKELLLRVKVLLKRVSRNDEMDESKVFHYQNLTLIKDSFQVMHDEAPLRLTKTEFHLLLLFFEHPGRFFTREEIINRVWNEESYITERTVDVHIQRLRKKLKSCKDLISTYSGIGYGYFPVK